RQDRAAGDVVFVQDIHGLELGLGHGPLFDRVEDVPQSRQPGGGLGVVRVGDPFRLADDVADRLPYRGLGDEVNIGVRVRLPSLAFQDPARLAAAGRIACAGYR